MQQYFFIKSMKLVTMKISLNFIINVNKKLRTKIKTKFTKYAWEILNKRSLLV